jgi:hypothetical protein
LALLLTGIGCPGWAGDLVVAIPGVRSTAGTLMIGLYAATVSRTRLFGEGTPGGA